jgi:serpin B
MDAAYRSLIDLLRSLDASVDLRIANSIWYRQEVPFTPAFLDLTRRYFDAEVAAKDFDSPRTADDINAWAARSTNGKIPRIVDFIPSEMVMYLVNAIYFKGGWVQRFEPSATKVEPFTLASGAVVTAPLMHLEHSLPYAETATYQAVDLAYGRSAYSMTVLSPKAGTSVAALAAALDGDAWTSLARQFDGGDSTRVALALPKFRLTWGDSLNVPLKSLGMRIAFTRDTADFTGMAPVPLGRSRRGDIGRRGRHDCRGWRAESHARRSSLYLRHPRAAQWYGAVHRHGDASADELIAGRVDETRAGLIRTCITSTIPRRLRRGTRP